MGLSNEFGVWLRYKLMDKVGNWLLKQGEVLDKSKICYIEYYEWL